MLFHDPSRIRTPIRTPWLILLAIVLITGGSQSVLAFSNLEMLGVCSQYNITPVDCFSMFNTVIPLILNTTLCPPVSNCTNTTIVINNTVNVTEYVPVPYQVPFNGTIPNDCTANFTFLTEANRHAEEMLKIEKTAALEQTSVGRITIAECDLKTSEAVVAAKTNNNQQTTNDYVPPEKDFFEENWVYLAIFGIIAFFGWKKYGQKQEPRYPSQDFRELPIGQLDKNTLNAPIGEQSALRNDVHGAN